MTSHTVTRNDVKQLLMRDLRMFFLSPALVKPFPCSGVLGFFVGNPGRNLGSRYRLTRKSFKPISHPVVCELGAEIFGWTASVTATTMLVVVKEETTQKCVENRIPSLLWFNPGPSAHPCSF